MKDIFKISLGQVFLSDSTSKPLLILLGWRGRRLWWGYSGRECTFEKNQGNIERSRWS